MKGAKKPAAPIRKGRKEKDDHEEPEFVAPVCIKMYRIHESTNVRTNITS